MLFCEQRHDLPIVGVDDARERVEGLPCPLINVGLLPGTGDRVVLQQASVPSSAVPVSGGCGVEPERDMYGYLAHERQASTGACRECRPSNTLRVLLKLPAFFGAHTHQRLTVLIHRGAVTIRDE